MNKGETLNQIRYRRLAKFAKRYGVKEYEFFRECDIMKADLDNLETDFELNRLGYFDQKYVEVQGLSEVEDGTLFKYPFRGESVIL